MDFASQLIAPFSDSDHKDALPQQPPQISTLIVPDRAPATDSAPASAPDPAPEKPVKKSVRKKRQTRTFPVKTSYTPPTKAMTVNTDKTRSGTSPAPLVVRGRAFTSTGATPSGKETLFSGMMTDTIHAAKIAHLCRKAEALGISAGDAIEVAIDLFNVTPTGNIKVDGRSVTVD